ncbi:paraquat-inducible protein A [Jannaschia sp. Os4]|uniref:paraquat-inducible protein A n=1 Tax=Jannaschia sp. Os4 TaxID=2807617 RepID=UPI0019399A3C|nr:paraquat-inducible protein A [Jannaschia sp. Os4]MBM2574899.1 paraquat-inducible protein A [Jannaschia sp. Os4]
MASDALPGGAPVCCPTCDALHEIGPLAKGQRARCIRCGTVLAMGRPEAIARVVALALASLILMGIVVFFPFLQLKNGVFTARASVFDTVMTFDSGIMAPLSLAVGAFIIVLPATRFAALIWSLGPLAFDARPWPGAARLLRLAIALKPWAMAEIFMVGVAIALVKLADLATLTMGPAFWAFGAIVLIAAFKDTQMTRHTLWTALEQASGTPIRGGADAPERPA